MSCSVQSQAVVRFDFQRVPPRYEPVLPVQEPAIDRGLAVEAALDALEDGIVITDQRGKVIHTNRVARELIAKSGCVTVGNGRLCGGTLAMTRTLQAAIAASFQSDAPAWLWLDGAGSRQLVTVRSGRLATTEREDGKLAIVILRSPGRAEDMPARTVQTAFQLTSAEARVAREVVKGDGLKACARRLGVTTNTARTHLNRIFGKTGTNRQAELVRLLMSCRLE